LAAFLWRSGVNGERRAIAEQCAKAAVDAAPARIARHASSMEPLGVEARRALDLRLEDITGRPVSVSDRPVAFIQANPAVSGSIGFILAFPTS
jgi:hypothetical protein